MLDKFLCFGSHVVPVLIEQWIIHCQSLCRFKTGFDAVDIEIPYPHLAVYPGSRKDSYSPMRPVSLDGNTRVGAKA